MALVERGSAEVRRGDSFDESKKLYVGFTKNLKARLAEHAAGMVIATRYRRPLRLIHYEYFVNIADAKAREIFLKSGAGHSQLKAFLKRTLNYR